MIQLNQQQEKAVELIKEWYSDKSNPIFTLAGYAGTGKTFLINYLISYELDLSDDEVAFIAYTGKATSVLSQKTGKEASTIHRLIYNTVEVTKTIKENDKEVEVKKIEFAKKQSIGPLKLIILDEVSMVDQYILDDILSFKIKILCCGDIAQLPAIVKQNTLLDKPDYMLTEIVRQSKDNKILKLATMARENTLIPFGNYGDAAVINQRQISESLMKKILTGADQIICGTNRTRDSLNNLYRSYLGVSNNPLPQKGEKLICVMNNYEVFMDEDKKYNLVNGTIGNIINNVSDKNNQMGVIDFVPEFLNETTEDILIDTGIFTDKKFKYDMHQKAYLLDDGKYIIKNFKKRLPGEQLDDFKKRISELVSIQRSVADEKILNQFEFAYAISCHKSQGSEWDKVVVFDESNVFRQNASKWLYTAITRAKKKLIIIR